MASIPNQLRVALDALYDEFARYRPQGPIGYSPFKSHSVVAPLETKPLRELTADDLSAYSGAAIWTVGSEEDFKYFFPRIAELALHEVVGGSGWDSWAFRLGPALGTPSEREVAKAFFRSLWNTVAESYWDVVQVDSHEILYALPFLFDDIDPFLASFHPCGSRASALNLKDICNCGPKHTSDGAEPSHQITRWLAERAPSALHEAAATFPDS